MVQHQGAARNPPHLRQFAARIVALWGPVQPLWGRTKSKQETEPCNEARRELPVSAWGPDLSPIEAQLIREASQGDGRAVRALYDRYAPRVYAVVRRIAGDDDLAQDYAQEAWIRAIRALPTFRGDARFSTWLHRIAVNSALQAVRKAKTRTKREVQPPEVIAVAPQVGDALLARQLEAALDQLPEGMRKVLILHDVEGFTHEEIGGSLGVTAGTSKSQLFKARAKMRQFLGANDIHHEEMEA
ncbi:MAG: RNA polymerase sigma factor [Longimicrobiales bacterium]